MICTEDVVSKIRYNLILIRSISLLKNTCIFFFHLSKFQLDPNMGLKWNSRLRLTAGRCRCKPNGTADIELSIKVCDTPGESLITLMVKGLHNSHVTHERIYLFFLKIMLIDSNKTSLVKIHPTSSILRTVRQRLDMNYHSLVSKGQEGAKGIEKFLTKE